MARRRSGSRTGVRDRRFRHLSHRPRRLQMKARMPLRHVNTPSCGEPVRQCPGRARRGVPQPGGRRGVRRRKTPMAGREEVSSSTPGFKHSGLDSSPQPRQAAALLGTAHTLLPPPAFFLRIALQGSIQTGKVNFPANPATRPPIAPAPTIMAKMSTSTALSFHLL